MVGSPYTRLLRYFHYDHLPEQLQRKSKPFHDLAYDMVAEAGRAEWDITETMAGLRKLLEAKDCMVRASLTW